MFVYLLRRLLAMIPTLLGITFITFIIINLAPGDPVATAFGQAGGGGKTADGSGGGDGQDRQADAIKAKKKLLGMVIEDYSLGAWSPPSAPDENGELLELVESGRLAELESWPRVMSWVGEDILVGTQKGALALIGAQGDILQQTQAGEEAVQSMAVSPDGKTAATLNASGELRLWSLPGLSPGATASLPRGGREMIYTPNGAQIIVASDDGPLRVLSSETGALERSLEGAISGSYALTISADGSILWSGGYDRTLRAWSMESGEILQESKVHSQAINDLSLSADGQRLASASDDRNLRVFTLQDKLLQDPEAKPQLFSGHYKEATSVLLDQGVLYSGSRDETIRTWDLGTGQQISQNANNVGRVSQLLKSSSGELISASDSWRKVPVAKRYWRWLVRMATLDFDRSFVDDVPVIDKIAKALPVTIWLNIIAVSIIYVISIPMGIMAAVKRNSAYDHISSIVLFVLYSIPSFWLATLLIMFFSSKLNWDILPSVGLHADNAQDLSYLSWFWDSVKHLVLPITCMVYGGFASLSRYARTTMLETIQEDYVRTARAKGLPEQVVIWKHAFRNSLITIVTLLGNLLPRMIGGSVIIEYIFSIDGMGRLGFNAILARDYPVIMAITTFSAVLTLLGILISDLLYSVVDPRVTQK